MREEIVPGVGFHGDGSFSQLAVPLDFSRAAEIQFELKPGELDGVLLYAEDNTDTESFFYLALYNGHLFGVHQPAQGQAQVLRPSSNLLMDQQWHLVELNITAGSISVQVNGNSEASTGVLAGVLSSEHLYLAGVTLDLQQKLDRCEACPVVGFYTGGMQDVRVNGRELDFLDPTTVLSQRGVYLSGLVPPQNVTAPTLPPPGPTVAPPSCADPFQPAYSGEGVNFGRHGNSFVSFNLSPETMREYFRTSFVLRCEFRAEAPDGILYYTANNRINPDNYLALYMSGGYLHADMKTLQPNNGAYHNLNVRTQFRDYADGRWWEVVILRIHNFLAIIVPERRDYVNNNKQSNTETFIDLTTPLYVGGTDILADFPIFPLEMKTGFAGCIRLLEISTAQPVDTVTFDLGSPDNQYNVGQCYEAVHPGTSFNGTGFATMGEYSLESGLDVSVRFSTVQRSFLLLLLFQDAANYFLMDAEDGRIRVHLRKNGITTTIRIAHVETGYEVCDGEFHTVVFSANRFQQMGLDDISVIGKLQVGGVPDAASLASPGLTQTPFQGCLESLVFNGVTQDFRQTALTEHVTSGCPARP
ncbi:LAMA2 [Branchiostoma lanceolatum]|uniref:LAMA2 protein n=1 Tax=Branchiostoma lanceolatum TaxID=7740 RepID=A0A8J9ZFB8_BRALA|nr:LAMA2 [Branchiostoma lanceolatum]